jgi:hypothetical protein
VRTLPAQVFFHATAAKGRAARGGRPRRVANP